MITSLRPRCLKGLPVSGYVCPRCQTLSTSAVVGSGHNRFSKIKSDKSKVDRQKTKHHSLLANDLFQASKLFGPDPSSNPRLANALAAAKQASYPKASIESAIARGQGITSSGSALQPLVVEAMLPPSVAVVIDCQTPSKGRTLHELRLIMKDNEANMTPTSYMFKRRGRILFERDERGLSAEDLLDDAVDAGAEDVEVDQEGNIMIYTEPNKTASVASTLAKPHNLKIQSSDIIWDPNEDTLVDVESESAAHKLGAFVDELRENPSVQGVYMNIRQGGIDDNLWASLRNKLAV